MKGTPRILTHLGIVILALMAGCCSIRHDIAIRNQYIPALETLNRAVDSVNHYRRIVREQQRTIDSLIQIRSTP